MIQSKSLKIKIKYSTVYKLLKQLYISIYPGGVFIDNKGAYIRLKRDIIGKNNTIIIEEDVVLNKTRIRIRGNNNYIIIGKGCSVGENCSFWMEGNNISVKVGEGCTFTRDCEINAQEDNVSIVIGDDCMFSNNIIVRTSDSHPIFDCLSDKRINEAKNVMIGNHVWIAPNTKVMKGSRIGDGAIIGSDSMVTGNVSNNVLAVGHPARVVKQGIYWTRESVINKDDKGI